VTIIEIEAKKSVLTATRKNELDQANLALGPLQTQMSQLTEQAHRIQLEVTERAARIDGQLALYEELLAELKPPAAPEATPVATDVPGVGSSVGSDPTVTP
jgi:hypothetical protein